MESASGYKHEYMHFVEPINKIRSPVKIWEYLEPNDRSLNATFQKSGIMSTSLEPFKKEEENPSCSIS